MATPQELKREYWSPPLESITPEARKVFEEYSKIPSDRVIPHIMEIRERAWQVLPFPCIGKFHFLDMSISHHPLYTTIIERVKHGDRLLDLGCCFGQDVRKLVVDDAPAENLIGSDLRASFIELGYDLFLDKDTLKAKFIASDVFDPESELLKTERGSVSIVHAASMIHLFDLPTQKQVVKTIIDLLKPESGSLVVGRQVGSLVSGDKPSSLDPSKTMFWHDEATFAKMWHDVGKEVGGVKFEVAIGMKQNDEWTKTTNNPQEKDPNFRIMTFSVKRV
ncbi:hypothetical protein MBLNU459_g4438t1 [Dothideomycetes sp. NU459]